MLCLFDIDGTLISTPGAGRRAFERACLEVLEVEGALEGIRLDGMTDPLILDEVYARRLPRGARPGEREAVLARYVALLPGELAASDYIVHRGVHAALDRLAELGATVGLATGNVEAGARAKLERGQLWQRFAFGGYGSDAADRGALVGIARQRGERIAGRIFQRAEALVLGDTPRDVAAARAAGCYSIALATGSYSMAELEASGADRVYPSCEEWLDELGAPPR
jgi:phosphoglycolate phosphatase-like HAD superfamily hydrolase